MNYLAVNYIELAKAQERAQEQQRAAYSDAVARENLIAAQIGDSGKNGATVTLTQQDRRIQLPRERDDPTCDKGAIKLTAAALEAMAAGLLVR